MNDQSDRDGIAPHFTNLQGLAVPGVDAMTPGKSPTEYYWLFVDNGTNFLAAPDLLPSSVFSSIQPGALVTFSANWGFNAKEVSAVVLPERAKVTDFDPFTRTYRARDAASGDYLELRQKDVTLSLEEAAGGLALEATLSYHKDEAGKPHHVIVETVPPLVTAWRNVADKASRIQETSRIFMAFALDAAGEKLRQLSEKISP